MHHVLIAGKIHDAGIALLRARNDVTLELVEAVNLEAYQPYLTSAHAVLIRTQPMTKTEIDMAPLLKIVSRHGVGFDAVDVDALTARNIPLTIVGDVNSRAVAEHTMMLMLAAARRTVAHHAAANSGNWNERNRFDACELDGKNLLLIGFGRIGRRVAQLAQAFGMVVVAYDPNVDATAMSSAGVVSAVDLLAALRAADVISMHMPASPQGAIIGSTEIKLMKSTVILVNAARGGLINEQALTKALQDKHIYAAAIDVFEQEPPLPGHPLFNLPGLTISPHNAGLTQECAKRMALAAAQNILDCFDGKLDQRLVVNATRLRV